MAAEIVFSPYFGWIVLAVLAALSLAAVVLTLVRGAPGWWLRGLAAAAVLVALANPSLKQELREPLSDIAFVVVDESDSQQIDGRDAATATTEAEVEAALEALVGGTCYHMTEVFPRVDTHVPMWRRVLDGEHDVLDELLADFSATVD